MLCIFPRQRTNPQWRTPRDERARLVAEESGATGTVASIPLPQASVDKHRKRQRSASLVASAIARSAGRESPALCSGARQLEAHGVR